VDERDGFVAARELPPVPCVRRRAAASADERRGHDINRWEDWNELAGHAHGITIDPASGARVGGADPRSDGAAVGY
jgi:gamma-glutamyltranspeptidase/glutathione hydrolase